ncbi:S8 family serine peptidase [Streptomyces sp. NPDC050535]|uniref:S8 family serine peptidase n=1 Tax=Streptomyces sp. NPDC050535 TaxID=3365626 RepID=UPI00378E0670
MFAPRLARPAPGTRRLATLSRVPRPLPIALCAALLTVCPAPAAQATAPSPTATTGATGSGETVRLPVIPGTLAPDASCTKESPTVMDATPWTHEVLGLSEAGKYAQGDGVTVAVVDTGVMPGARALKGRVTAAGDAGEDCVGHGSFVAGLIAGSAVDSTGADLGGMAPHARILAVRGTDAYGRTDADRVAAGIREAARAGAQVIAVPLALSEKSGALTSAVRYAATRDCLVVAAAAPDTGSGDDTATPAAGPGTYWPAAAEDVLSVLDFGPDGTRPEGAAEPASADLAAPGDKVVGTGPRGRGAFTGSGPSFATAFVAGAAALVRSREPRLTAQQTARRLTSTAYPADAPRLDVYAALTSVPHGHTSAAPLPASPRPVVLSLSDGTGAMRIAGSVVASSLVLLLAAVAVRGTVRGRRRRDEASVEDSTAVPLH